MGGGGDFEGDTAVQPESPVSDQDCLNSKTFIDPTQNSESDALLFSAFFGFRF